MEYEWDARKAARNFLNHGVSFQSVVHFAWEEATIIEDTRKAYGEPHWIAYDPIGKHLHCLVFTLRDNHIRVISLRKANSREVKRYDP